MGRLVSLLTQVKEGLLLPQVVVKESTADFVRESLSKLPSFGDSGMKLLNLDSKYWLPDRNSFLSFVQKDWTEKKPYISEIYDCENFALRFKTRAEMAGTNGVGVVIDYSAGHAYNLVVFDYGGVELFEPQQDKWVQPGDGLYKFEWGFILI